jgi:hypothetical protein
MRVIHFYILFLDVDLQFTPADSRLPGISSGLEYIDSVEKDAFFNYSDLKGEPMDVEIPFVQSIESDLELLEQMDDGDQQDINELIARIEDLFLGPWEEPHAPIVNTKTFLLK